MLHLASDQKEIEIQAYQTHCWGTVVCGKCILVFVVLEVSFSFLWWFLRV